MQEEYWYLNTLIQDVEKRRKHKKKKKKKKHNYTESSEFDQDILDSIADSLAMYVSEYDQFAIGDNWKSKKEYTNTIKEIEKYIKKLREGKGDEVLNVPKYQAVVASMKK